MSLMLMKASAHGRGQRYYVEEVFQVSAGEAPLYALSCARWLSRMVALKAGRKINELLAPLAACVGPSTSVGIQSRTHGGRK